ncbi:hypothetical protein BGX24_011918, partial [Mortierella sp. AD032]
SPDINPSSNNNPIQVSLHGGQEPTLEALIQALPPNWTDAKLKVHSGAVELSSLSSRHPAEIMYDIKMVVLRLGIEIRSDSDFKIKCVRRKRKTSGNSGASGSNSGVGANAGGGVGSGSVNGGAGHGTTLSVKSLLQGHGLHINNNNNNNNNQHHNNNKGPDDTASVMSSNMSIDREAWVSNRSVLGGFVGAGAGSSVIQGGGSGSVIGTSGTTASGKKKNGIRTILWRNSTSANLASVTSPPHTSPSSPVAGGGGTAMVAQGSVGPSSIMTTRQLSQVMNGSSLGLVSGSGGGSGFAGTTVVGSGVAGQGLMDSVATETSGHHHQYHHHHQQDSAVPVASAMPMGGEDSQHLRPCSEVGISSSTTATTIGAATTSHSSIGIPPPLQHLQQQQAMLAATTSTSADGEATCHTPTTPVEPHHTTNNTNPSATSTVVEPLYGEEAIDSGEEIRFSIELCRMKNLRGLYSVDIRRVKGNRWAYKFLYHAILNTLDLQGKGGYLTGGQVGAAGQVGGFGSMGGGVGGGGGSSIAPNVAMSLATTKVSKLALPVNSNHALSVAPSVVDSASSPGMKKFFLARVMADGDNAMDVDEESYFFNIVTSPKKVFQVTADHRLQISQSSSLCVKANRTVAAYTHDFCRLFRRVPTFNDNTAFCLWNDASRPAGTQYRPGLPIHLSPACIYIFLASSALAREQGFGRGAGLERLRLRYIKTVNSV